MSRCPLSHIHLNECFWHFNGRTGGVQRAANLRPQTHHGAPRTHPDAGLFKMRPPSSTQVTRHTLKACSSQEQTEETKQQLKSFHLRGGGGTTRGGSSKPSHPPLPPPKKTSLHPLELKSPKLICRRHRHTHGFIVPEERRESDRR